MAAHAPARVTRAGRAELLAGIYAILDDAASTLDLARAVLTAGVRVLQYRAKSCVCAERLQQLHALVREYDCVLIVNDDWRAALAFDCDGVHLGPGDDGFAAPERLRDAMPDRLIGLSCGTSDEILRANDGDVDYIGAGCVFATPSKTDAGAPIGVEGLAHLARLAQLPVAAIGGITETNLGQVRATGVAMAAVISAIDSASQPGLAAARLVSHWNAKG